MRKFDWRWLVVLIALTKTSACGSENSVGAVDGSVEDCDGRSDESCEGSQLPTSEDGSVDEGGRARDAGDAASDEDVADAAQVDEQEPEPDARVDEGVDPQPDAGADAGGEPDAGLDAETPDPIDCRDYECGFGTCDIANAPTACDCVTGYLDQGAGCEWTGAVEDQELEVADAWEGQNMVFEGGVARFESEGVGRACELGVLEQTLRMPARAESQAFVIELDVLSGCEGGDAEQCPALQVELGSSVTRLVVAGAAGAAAAPIARSVSACLGSAGYGGDVTLRVRPALAYQGGELPLLCESAEWPAIDRIAIRPAEEGECSEPDALAGSLASSAGWTLANATVTGNQLAIASGGRASVAVSVASVRQGKALQVRVDGAADTVDFKLDGLTWARIPTRALPQILCLPEWVHGASHRLELGPTAGAATVTEIQIVTNESCGTNAFDHGFDRTLPFSSWSSTAGTLAAVTGSTGRGIELTASTTLRASTRFGARAAGRSLIATARYQASSTQTNTVRYGLDPAAGQAYQGPALRQYLVCLPDAWEHQLATLKLDVTMTPVAPATMTRMFLDDLYATTTDLAGCP